MTRFKELGYTDKDFAPNQMFVTQKVAETAIAAGIVAIRPIKPEIRLLGDFIDQHVTDPRYKLPGQLDDLSFVLRWAGKDSKWIWQWDTKIHKASQDTRFLNGWNLSVEALDELRLGGQPAGSKTLAEMNPFLAVEISVEEWENPRLSKQFVKGVLFNQAQRRGKTLGENVSRDVFEAFDPESLNRFKLGDLAEEVTKRPFDDIMPIAGLVATDLNS